MPTPKYDYGDSPIATMTRKAFWDEEFEFFLPGSTTNAVANASALAVTDEVRFRLFDGDNTTELFTITDLVNSTNGSSITIDDRGTLLTTPAKASIKIINLDTDLAPGDYRFIIDVKDVSDSDRYQTVSIGFIRIKPGPT